MVVSIRNFFTSTPRPRSTPPPSGRPGRRLLASALLTALPASAEAFSPTFVWPGPAPCGTPSLASCLLATPDGSIVQVASNSPVVELLIVDRYQVLTAAPGFSPIVGEVKIAGAGGEVRNLTIRGRVALEVGKGMTSAKVRENVILTSGWLSAVAAIVPDPSTPPQPALEVTIEGNLLRSARGCISLVGLQTLPGICEVGILRNQMICGETALLGTAGPELRQFSVVENDIRAGGGLLFWSDLIDERPAAPMYLKVLRNQVTSTSVPGFSAGAIDSGGPIELSVSENFFAGWYGLRIFDLSSARITGTVSRNVFGFDVSSWIQLEGAQQVAVEGNVQVPPPLP